MIQINSTHDQEPTRDDRFTELQSRLSPAFPTLSEVVNDMGPVDLFFVNPELHGRAHSVWLTDGEVSGSIEMNGLHDVPRATFALQTEIIPLQDSENPDRRFFGWNMLMLHVAGDYEPSQVVSTIHRFGRSNDAYAMLHYLSRKTGHPADFDLRTEQPQSLEQYLGVLDNIRNKALVISSRRHITEFQRFLAGNEIS